MLKTLFGRTLLPDSGSLIPSSRIMVFSLTVSPSEDTVVNWELRTNILLQLILKEQAEAINKVIVSGLKKMLDDTKGKWVEELPHVL